MLDLSSNSAPTDALTEILQGLRLEGLEYGQRPLVGSWGFSFPQKSHAYFHFVSGAACWLQLPSGEWLELSEGDAILLPRGDAHVLARRPDTNAQSHPPFVCRPLSAERLDTAVDHSGQTSLLFYGSMRFNLDISHPLLRVMPDVLQAKHLLGNEPAALHLLDAMAREMTTRRVGAAGMVARLADVLAAQIIRSWVEHGCADASGWIAAVRHPQIGRVLAAIHGDPERNWTLEDLAEVMGASRSGFAAKFLSLVGETPVRYLAAVRMQLARQWIIHDDARISEVAQRLHYESEASFSRSFKRVLGVPPSTYRTGPRPRQGLSL